MSNVAIASPTRVTPSYASPGRLSRADAAPTLLPAPSTSLAEGAGDAMSAIYMLLAKRRDENGTSGAARVETKKHEREHHLEMEKAAIQHEKDAEGDGSLGFFDTIGHLVSNIVDDATDLRVMDVFTDTKDNLSAAWDSPQFWSDVEIGAKVVGEAAAAVGAAAVTAVTLGAGGPLLALVIIGIAMSATSMVESETHFMEKMGVNANVAAGISIGLAVGGAALTAGAGMASSTTAVASSTAGLASRIGTAAAVTSGALQMTGGGAHIQTGMFQAEAKDAQGDVQAARYAIARSQRVQQMLIEGLVENAKSSQRTLVTLQGAITTQAQTVAIATMRV